MFRDFDAEGIENSSNHLFCYPDYTHLKKTDSQLNSTSDSDRCEAGKKQWTKYTSGTSQGWWDFLSIWDGSVKSFKGYWWDNPCLKMSAPGSYYWYDVWKDDVMSNVIIQANKYFKKQFDLIIDAITKHNASIR